MRLFEFPVKDFYTKICIDYVLVYSGQQTKKRLEACGLPVLERITEIKEVFNYSL
ncbi:MAG: hypothetical protein JW864_15110 [Spirochaetes bacterium]|nr:hypothetical protein [Spirochaetota bacterium]